MFVVPNLLNPKSLEFKDIIESNTNLLLAVKSFVINTFLAAFQMLVC